MTDFKKIFATYRERVNHTLNAAISSNGKTSLLRDAMLYSATNGGKRLRPLLVYATAASFNPRNDDALDLIAAAIECVHCYSLIHDDLPAMDDDSLRRGKPTCHIAFGEATAILAGDALQTLAFELLSKTQILSPKTQLNLVYTLAHHSGVSGMVAGQSLDLLSEGKTLSVDALNHIHRLKTGALIQASVTMGALGAGCEEAHTLQTLDQFSARLGLAFQLQDDLLDFTGNSQALGKQAGQDIKLNKATYATLFGAEKTKQAIEQLMQETTALLNTLTSDTSQLHALIHQVIAT